MLSSTLVCENDSDDPTKTNIKIVAEQNSIDNLDFFEDKSRVSTSKSKRVIYSCIYLFLN